MPPGLRYLLCFQDRLHKPPENLPASTPMPQPLEHNQNVCPGCIQNVFYYPRSRRWWIAFKISTRQVIQQNVILCAKADCPIALLNTQTAHRDASATNPNNDTACPSAPANNLPQQIAHCAAQIPLPMKTKFASRINQPVTSQRLQNIQPACPLTA